MSPTVACCLWVATFNLPRHSWCTGGCKACLLRCPYILCVIHPFPTAWAKCQSIPDCVLQVIGVEPSGANSMAMSLAQGRRVTLSRVDAFADGVAVKQVRDGLCFGTCMRGRMRPFTSGPFGMYVCAVAALTAWLTMPVTEAFKCIGQPSVCCALTSQAL